ncbi:MAG: DUF4271 domain-containing protein [Flavobacteriaceae bacterium]|nr:DUF4271 domain-containing protein [Flavobacteriaceae bacterium]
MFEGIERVVFSRDWITIVLMLVLISIAIIKFAFNERFGKLFSLLYSEKYYTNYAKTKPIIFNKFHFYLSLVILFNFSLLFFFGFKIYYPSKISNDISFFIQIIAVVILYASFRYLVGSLLAFLFDISEYQKHLTLLKISNLSLIFVLSFPLLILITYSNTYFHKFLIIISIIAVSLLLLFRYFVIVNKIRGNFNILFYFILYLCALEIAPIIVIYKMFID